MNIRPNISKILTITALFVIGMAAIAPKAEASTRYHHSNYNIANSNPLSWNPPVNPLSWTPFSNNYSGYSYYPAYQPQPVNYSYTYPGTPTYQNNQNYPATNYPAYPPYSTYPATGYGQPAPYNQSNPTTYYPDPSYNNSNNYNSGQTTPTYADPGTGASGGSGQTF